jgi:hypothetical protein
MSRGTLTDGRVRRKKNSCSKFLPTARNRERRSLLSENNQKEKGKGKGAKHKTTKSHSAQSVCFSMNRLSGSFFPDMCFSDPESRSWRQTGRSARVADHIDYSASLSFSYYWQNMFPYIPLLYLPIYIA